MLLKRKIVRGKVFDRNRLLKAIEKIKEISSACTTAIEAMETILYN